MFNRSNYNTTNYNEEEEVELIIPVVGGNFSFRKKRKREHLVLKTELVLNVDGILAFKFDIVLDVIGKLKLKKVPFEISTLCRGLKSFNNQEEAVINGSVSEKRFSYIFLEGLSSTEINNDLIICGTSRFGTEDNLAAQGIISSNIENDLLTCGILLNNINFELAVNSRLQVELQLEPKVSGTVKKYLNEEILINGKKDIRPLILSALAEY